MSFSYIGNNHAAASAATEIDCAVSSGIAAGDIEIFVVAFEGVAAGSGPWIIPNNGQFSTDYIGPFTQWQQILFQSPSATGVGIEVWAAIFNSGGNHFAKFAASQNAVGVCAAYSGEYNPTGLISGGAIRLSSSAQVTGNQPAAPSVVANSGELVIAIGGDLMGVSGFGTPSGTTNRIDTARSGAGTVEATIADFTTSSAGATGPITFPNAAAGTSVRGATATLAISPAPTTASSGPLLEAPMPPNLDLGPGYTLRVTALSTVDGSQVSGVTVSNFSVLVQDTGEATSNLAVGPYMLVPGPQA